MAKSKAELETRLEATNVAGRYLSIASAPHSPRVELSKLRPSALEAESMNMHASALFDHTFTVEVPAQMRQSCDKNSIGPGSTAVSSVAADTGPASAQLAAGSSSLQFGPRLNDDDVERPLPPWS